MCFLAGSTKYEDFSRLTSQINPNHVFLLWFIDVSSNETWSTIKSCFTVQWGLGNHLEMAKRKQQQMCPTKQPNYIELSILTGQPHAHRYISYACLTYSVEFSTTLNGVWINKRVEFNQPIFSGIVGYRSHSIGLLVHFSCCKQERLHQLGPLKVIDFSVPQRHHIYFDHHRHHYHRHRCWIMGFRSSSYWISSITWGPSAFFVA